MKKLLLLLLVTGAFAFTAVAQDAAPTSSASGQTTTKKKSSKSDEHAGMAMDHEKKSSKGGANTLTGCISTSANSEGMYTLSNGRYKKGVEIGPADKVKEHAGHQVELTGKWSNAAAAGEANAVAGKEKGERHFEVNDVRHISETCSTAPGGGTTGAKNEKKGKGEKKSSAAATPPQI